AAKKFLDTSLADLRAQLDLNLATAFLCCREAARRMGGGRGRIVNVASRAAVAPAGGMIGYSVSKAAIVALTQSVAEEPQPPGHPLHPRPAVDTRHAGEPEFHAQPAARLRALAEAVRGRRRRPVAREPLERAHVGRRASRVRPRLRRLPITPVRRQPYKQI